jgi:hypothetical protein
VTQHGVERLPAKRLVCPLPCAPDEPHPPPDACLFTGESLARFREHLRGGVDDGDFVASAGQWDGLLARSAANVGYTGRGWGKVFGERAVYQLVADNLAQDPAR